MKLLEPIKVGNIELKRNYVPPPYNKDMRKKMVQLENKVFVFYERLAKAVSDI